MPARSRPSAPPRAQPAATLAGSISGIALTVDPLAQLGIDDRRVGEPGAERVDRDPALGELRRDRADEADDRVLRQRVDRVERHRHQPGERSGRDDRRPGLHHLRHPPRPEDDAVDVRADRAPVLRRRRARRCRSSRWRRRRSGTRSRRRPTSSHAARICDVESGREVERPHLAPLRLEQRDGRRPDPGGAAGDERATEQGRPCRRGGAPRSRRAPQPPRRAGTRRPTTGRIAPWLPQADQLLRRLADDLRSELHQPAEVEAGDAHVPPDDERRVERPPTCRPRSRSRSASRAASAPSATRRRPRLRPGRRPRRRAPRPRTPRTQYASSAPCSSANARFSSEPAVATTRAPRWRASWIAAQPTPPAPAWTSTVDPGTIRACRA